MKRRQALLLVLVGIVAFLVASVLFLHIPEPIEESEEVRRAREEWDALRRSLKTAPDAGLGPGDFPGEGL